MRSLFWTFVEICDAANSVRSVSDLLASTLRSAGVGSYALLTHAPRHDLRSLAVVAHNWSMDAIDHLLAQRPDGRLNPIFERIEQTPGALHWTSPHWQASLNRSQHEWLSRFHQLVGREGVSQAMTSIIVGASCSMTSDAPLDPDRVRVCMRIANFAFHQIQFLQRPQLSGQERLTAREHECLYRAAAFGERPSAVARRLGVKVSTIRTLRQKAYGRLDADSPEQAVWRMLETGQLFRSGRRSKPRSR